MLKQPYAIAKLALTALAAACVSEAAFSRVLYNDALANAFWALALGSVVILHLRVRPKWQDAVLVTAGTATIAAVCFLGLHFPHAFMAWLSFAGLSSFLVLAVRLIWEKDRELLIRALAAVPLFVASQYLASTMIEWVSNAHPRTLDIHLMLFDASLRFQPAFIAGQLYATHTWLRNVSLTAYIGLAAPIMMVYAGQLLRDRKKAASAMVAFLIAGPLAILLCNLFPAAGPLNLFGHKFPFAPIVYARLVHVIIEPVAILGARNAMPSLQVALALLAWWYSRQLSWMERSIAFSFLALTAFAALGTGQDWAADLIVAVPLALTVQALSAYQLPLKDAKRQTAFAFGLATTLTWMLLFRYCTRLFWTSAAVPWCLVAGTLALTTIRQRILDDAMEAVTKSGPAVCAEGSRTAEQLAIAEGLAQAHGPVSRAV